MQTPTCMLIDLYVNGDVANTFAGRIVYQLPKYIWEFTKYCCFKSFNTNAKCNPLFNLWECKFYLMNYKFS